MIAVLVKTKEGWEFWGWVGSIESAQSVMEEVKADGRLAVVVDPEGVIEIGNSGQCLACGRPMM